MIGSDIVEKAYRIANKSLSTFLDGNSTNIYKDLNTCYGQRILDILRVRVDKNASIEEATTDLISVVGLVAGDNGYNGEYAFPTDLLKPTRFEVSYDGRTWLKCTIYDNALNLASEYNTDQLASVASQAEPVVDFSRNSYKIRPVKTSAGNIINGIYIEYEKRQDDFTANSSPTEIEANLQDVLAYDLVDMEIVMHADKYSPQYISVFRAKKQEVEQRFLEFYQNRLGNRKTLTLKTQNYF